MDAKKLGSFIADQRKRLGLTQAELAEKLHVTDKAVTAVNLRGVCQNAHKSGAIIVQLAN